MNDFTSPLSQATKLRYISNSYRQKCHLLCFSWRLYKVLKYLENLSDAVLNNEMISYYGMQKVTSIENGCPVMWDFWERKVMAAVNEDDPSAAGKDPASRAGNRSLYRTCGEKQNLACPQQDFLLFFFSFLLHQLLPHVTLQLLTVLNWLEAAF